MERKFLKVIFANLILGFMILTFPSAFLKGEEDKHEHSENEKPHSEEKEKNHADHGHDEADKDDHEKNSGEHADHNEEDSHGHAEESGEEGHGHEEESAKFGPGKAILAVKNEGQKFQLSPESINFLKISFEKISSSTNLKESIQNFEIPSIALVSFQSKKGVFVSRDGWIELIEVKILQKKEGQLVIDSKKLKTEDLVAVKGVAFIRVAHLEASGQGGEGHAH